MKVWRVEHEKYTDVDERPIGPYRTGSELPEELKGKLRGMYEAHCYGQRPTPYMDDQLIGIQWREVCGLNSRSALDAWFEGWHDVLEATGFTVSVYEAPKGSVRVGDLGQVAFDFNQAKRVGAEFWSVVA